MFDITVSNKQQVPNRRVNGEEGHICGRQQFSENALFLPGQHNLTTTLCVFVYVEVEVKDYY